MNKKTYFSKENIVNLFKKEVTWAFSFLKDTIKYIYDVIFSLKLEDTNLQEVVNLINELYFEKAASVFKIK